MLTDFIAGHEKLKKLDDDQLGLRRQEVLTEF
jgi:hypothetical protein